MNLDEQLKTLIDQAPKYGVSSQIIEQAFAPILKLLAWKLQHPEFYLMQTQDKNLVLNVLANNEQPEEKKKVIYAYASSEDAISSHSNSKEELIPQSVPVTHILFQLFALKQVDSMIFMHEPGNPNSGIEVKRSDLVNLIQEELQQLSNTPPNLA